MMPSHEKKMIKMIKLPWRGRAETFPHTTEAEPKLSFFKIRDFQCDCNLDLRWTAVIVSGAVIVSIASVLKQRSSIQRCILTSSSSRHQRHRHLDFIEPSADATVILKWHLENFSTNPLLTWLLTPTDNTKINTSDLNMADLWRLQGWCFWLLSWFWFWIIRNQCIALYSFKAKWDK